MRPCGLHSATWSELGYIWFEKNATHCQWENSESCHVHVTRIFYAWKCSCHYSLYVLFLCISFILSPLCPTLISTLLERKTSKHSYKYTFTHPHIVSLVSYPRVFYYKRHRMLFGIFCAWKKKLLSMYTNWVFAYL